MIAHPVQGEARAEQTRDTYPIASAREVASASLRGQQRRDFLAGWDARTAHAAAEVEQLKAVEVKSGENLTGTGRVLSLWRGHNVIWSHAFHIDGPLDGYELMRGLMRAARLTEHGAEGTG